MLYLNSIEGKKVSARTPSAPPFFLQIVHLTNYECDRVCACASTFHNDRAQLRQRECAAVFLHHSCPQLDQEQGKLMTLTHLRHASIPRQT